MTTPTLGVGTYVLAAPCPECGTVVDLLVRLSSVLTVPMDEDPKLRARLRGTPAAHRCRTVSGQVTVDAALATVCECGHPLADHADRAGVLECSSCSSCPGYAELVDDEEAAS